MTFVNNLSSSNSQIVPQKSRGLVWNFSARSLVYVNKDDTSCA